MGIFLEYKEVLNFAKAFKLKSGHYYIKVSQFNCNTITKLICLDCF